jgi:hypothetical protein
MKRGKDMNLKLFFTAIVLFGIAPIASFAKESNSIEVFLSPEESILWRTLEDNTVVFPVNLGMYGADSAVLTIAGMRHKKVVSDITTESYSYVFPIVSSEGDEDVYEVSLEYFKSGESLGIFEKATLGSVSSIGEDSAISPCRNESTSKWSTMTGKTVIEIPYGSKALQIDDDKITLDGSATWFGWAPASYGTASALTLNDVYTASVTPLANGLLIICR